GTGDVYYFDDLSFSKATVPSEETETTVTLTPTTLAFDTASTIDFGGNTSVLVDDGSAPSDETRGNIVKVTKEASAETWAGTTITTLSEGEFISSGDTVVTLDVYAPEAGKTIRLKLEDSTNGDHFIEVDAVTTVANGWETLSFNFAAQVEAHNYDKASVFFDFGNAGTGDVYYFDDLSFSKAVTETKDAAPDNITVAATTLTFDTADTIDFGGNTSSSFGADTALFVGTVSATDPEGGVLTYSISGKDKDLFVIDGETGALSFASIEAASASGSYYVFAHATDDAGKVTTMDVNVLLNAAPSGEVKISGTAKQGEVLTADTSALVDLDEIGALSYQWQANGADIADANGKTLSLSQDQVGKKITLNVSYKDGLGKVENVSTTQLTAVENVNDNPVGDVTIVGDVKEGEILQASTEGLSDADGLGELSYQWYADGSAIEGATSSSLLLAQDAVGKIVKVVVSYTDLQGTSETVTSAETSLVANVNDPATGQVGLGVEKVDKFGEFTGVAFEGATAELISDNVAMTEDNGGSILAITKPVGAQPWAGATIKTLDAGAFISSVSKTLQLDVYAPKSGVTIRAKLEDSSDNTKYVETDVTNTVVDGWETLTFDFAQHATTPFDASYTYDKLSIFYDFLGEAAGDTVYIDNLVHFEASTEASLALSQGDVVHVDIASIDDQDGLGDITLTWYADDNVIEDATSNSYQMTQDEVGKVISVEASFTDGFGSEESILSSPTAAVINVNDDPSGSVVIDGTAALGVTLQANTTNVQDLDGLGSFSYQWYSDGNAIQDAVSATYTPSSVDLGTVITVQVSYTDQGGTSEVLVSAGTDAVRDNAPPSGTVTITGNAIVGETLSINQDLQDADGLGDLSYQWAADGTAIEGATSSTYVLTSSEVGKNITAIVSYVDGLNVEEQVVSTATDTVLSVVGATHHSFSVGNNDYVLVAQAKSYADAVSYAASFDQELATFETAGKVTGFYDAVQKVVADEGLNVPTASDGGGAKYVWLGANDIAQEGTWVWESGESLATNNPQWGSGSLGSEPDNYQNQDGLALGLENWPAGFDSGAGYGDAGSWNDVDVGNSLYFVMELPNNPVTGTVSIGGDVVEGSELTATNDLSDADG
ncbi:MAG: hypothetical protein EBT20_14485, partial [Alphaproteobacteria bacterium]|nr:hypothetical protein [Alphaproteobacteria bacterium]